MLELIFKIPHNKTPSMLFLTHASSWQNPCVCIICQICHLCYPLCYKILFLLFSMTLSLLFILFMENLIKSHLFLYLLSEVQLILTVIRHCIVSAFCEFVLNNTLILKSLKQIKILKNYFISPWCPWVVDFLKILVHC